MHSQHDKISIELLPLLLREFIIVEKVKVHVMTYVSCDTPECWFLLDR